LLTTIDDLTESARIARAAGRPVSASLLMVGVTICDARSVRAEEEALCTRVGLSWRPLAECPYVLLGEPTRIAEQLRERRERIGLDWVVVPDSGLERFSAEVMPLL
jgi:hypothetical protein